MFRNHARSLRLWAIVSSIALSTGAHAQAGASSVPGQSADGRFDAETSGVSGRLSILTSGRSLDQSDQDHPIIGNSSFHQSAGPITLSEILAKVRETYPALIEADASVAASAAELAQAKGRRYPTLDVFGQIGPTLNDRGTNNVPSFRFGTPVAGTVGITLNQPLFEPAIAREVDRQRARLESSELRRQERQALAMLDAARSYLEVLRLRENSRLSALNVQTHRALFEATSKRVFGKIAGVGDLEQMRERLSAVELTHQTIGMALRQALVVLEQFSGMRLSADALVDIEQQSYAALISPSIDDSFESVLARHPALLAARADIETARSELGAAKAGLGPSVRLEARASGNFDIAGNDQRVLDTQAGIVLRQNLSQGGVAVAQVSEHEARLAEAEARFDQRQREVMRTVREAWLDKARGEEALRIIAEQRRASERVESIYEREYEVGRRSLVDYLNSKAARFNVQTTQVDAAMALVFANLRIIAESAMMDALIRDAGQPVDGPFPGDAGALATRGSGIVPVVINRLDFEVALSPKALPKGTAKTTALATAKEATDVQ